MPSARLLLAALLLVLPAASVRALPLAPVPVEPVLVARAEAAARASGGAAGSLGADDSLDPAGRYRTADGGAIVRFTHRHRGLRVLGAVTVVRLKADGRVERTTTSASPLELSDVTPRISSGQAVRAARAALPNVMLPPEPASSVGLAISPAAGGRLVWVVDVPVLAPLMAPTVLVDAHTGELVSIRDRALRVGQGRIFPDGTAAKNARKSDGTFDGTGRVVVALPALTAPAQGGSLVGADILASSCCPNEGCDPAKPAKTVTSSYNGQPATTVACDEAPTAMADANADFLYEPAQEPVTARDPVPGPSEYDPFAEVMAYRWAQATLDWARTLDPQFELGPNARPLHVKANLLLPDFQSIGFGGLGGAINIKRFMRFDNAAFIPRGQGDAVDPLATFVPILSPPYDSLVFGQGTTADFAYDPDVVSHEFGHGIVSSVPGGLSEGSYVPDDWGLLDAPGAMNEGIADAIAAFRSNEPHIGEYIGGFLQAGEGSLRDLTGDYKCPSIIIGEVHQDSQHFSSALWAARVAVAGTSESDRLKYDQALLATIRQLTPMSDFDSVGKLMADEVGKLLGADAKAKALAEFDARKVTGCERAVDLVPGAPLSGYQLVQSLGTGVHTPGPVQFRLSLPAGASAIKLKLSAQAGGFGGGGGPLSVQALGREGERIHFSYPRNLVQSDATRKADFQQQGFRGGLSVAWSLEPACEAKTWFVALGNGGQDPLSVDSLSVDYSVDKAALAACSATQTPDAGTEGSGGDAPASPGGCACGASEGSFAMLAGLAGALARRRSRRA